MLTAADVPAPTESTMDDRGVQGDHGVTPQLLWRRASPFPLRLRVPTFAAAPRLKQQTRHCTVRV